MAATCATARTAGARTPAPNIYVRPLRVACAACDATRSTSISSITPDPQVPLAEAVGALADLQVRGLIRHIGISNVSVAELRDAQQVATIVSVQNMYNLAERGSADVLEVCTREGIAFLPWYPLATGDLARAGGVLQRIAARYQATPAQVALA